MATYKFKIKLKTETGPAEFDWKGDDIREAITEALKFERVDLKHILTIKQTPNIEWEQIEALIPEKLDLVYVDYNSNFDEHHEKIQECISAGNLDSLFVNEHDWFGDAQWDGHEAVCKELKSDLRSKYGISKKYARELMEEFENEITETIWDRDTSNPIGDSLDNTRTLIAHYDTGYYMEGESWNWPDARVRLERYAIKKHLGILDYSDADDSIEMMIRQATYGGQLLIYFNLDIHLFTKGEEYNTIKFTNAMIGIVDHGNGSGDVMDRSIPREIMMPFLRENVFLEKSIKYNWSYAIAGMCHDWADSTEVELMEENQLGTIPVSSTNDHLKQEAKYNATFKEGGCTTGDMDIKRHRKVTYINNFPCGNRCEDCMTFWID